MLLAVPVGIITRRLWTRCLVTRSGPNLMFCCLHKPAMVAILLNFACNASINPDAFATGLDRSNWRYRRPNCRGAGR